MAEEVKQQQQQLTEKKPVKRCHGNRKLQRFRRRCRSKGMNNQAIEMLMLIKKAKQPTDQDSPQIDSDEKEGQEDEQEEGMDDSNTIDTEIVIDMSMFFEDQVR